ncbi:MAG: hypothetical protein QOD99_1678, partial [Chthoniobacter sp.]|nr:hypothetical protein [Chthoniobacter sp.]
LAVWLATTVAAHASDPDSMAGMAGMKMNAPGEAAMAREASGTAWQPDSTPMHAYHAMVDDWMVMTHFNVFLNYDKQWSRRGDDQFDAINWFMLMGTHPLGGGELMLRTMLSLEPATATAHGYPLLFQSGEAFHGKSLVDRQHPHDFFMELAARYRQPLGEKASVFLYLAPSGEPALGPPAFMHRASAAENPAAPITHHWLDSTHISFGVATLGVSYDKLQVEGSAFNGREPDEDRWNIDTIHLDSYAGRVSFNPSERWSMQASHGYLQSPEELHPEESVRRTTASASYNLPLRDQGNWATTLAWGLNDEAGIRSNAVLLETNLNLADRNSIFGRIEYVQKTGEELLVAPERKKFDLTEVTVGASHELTPGRPYSVALGASLIYTFKPSSLDGFYGDHPLGLWVFFRIRPGTMDHGAMAMGEPGK